MPGGILISPDKIFALTVVLLLTLTSCKKTEGGDDPCGPVAAPQGRLVAETNGVYSFKTSGGGKIRIDLYSTILISHDDYPGFSLELWGIADHPDGRKINSGNHENLNGKHLKDRFGNRRTVIFPDGAKITWVTAGEYERILHVSIYHGYESHRITSECNTLNHSSLTAAEAKRHDEEEADGETATIEINDQGLLYINIYTEDIPGNKVMKRVPLGELFRGQPNHINDYFDDPRLLHT